MKNKVELSIIIVNYNTKFFLAGCLNSIYRTIKYISFEIIVIDNASYDGSRNLIKKDFPDIKFIQNNKNVGFPKANNKAIKRAEGKFFLILNPDTIVTEDAIEKMIMFMKKCPKVGVVGPYLLNGYGETQLSYLNFAFLPATDQMVDYFYEKFPSSIRTSFFFPRIKRKKPKKVALVMGACLLTKKEVFDSVGLFDEKIFMYGEDADFCYRASKKGFKVYFFPSVYIIHYGGRSSRFLRKKRIIEAKSYAYYVWKNLVRQNFLTIKRQTKFIFNQLYYNQ